MHSRIIGGWVCMLVLLISCQQQPAKQHNSHDSTGTNEKITLSTLNTTLLDSPDIDNVIDTTEKIQNKYPDSARAIYKMVLQRSNQINYKNGIIRSVFNAGRIDIMQGAYENGIGKFLLAIQYCDTIQDRKRLERFYNHLGSAYNTIGQFQLAMEAYYKALSYMRNGSSYNNIASLLGQLKQYDKALKYIDTALSMPAAIKDSTLRSTLLLNKASCYTEMSRTLSSKKYASAALKRADSIRYADSGLKYTDSGVAVARRFKLYKELSSGLINLGLTNMEMGRREAALNNLLEAVHISDTAGISMKQQVEALSNIGYIYLKLGQYANAEQYLMRAWQQVNTHSLPKDLLFLTETLSQLYIALGRSGEAHTYLQQAAILEDSLQSERVVYGINEREANYQMAEKDKKLMSNKLLISEQEKSIAKTRVLLLSITVTALVVIMLLSWRYLYKNRKEKSEREVERIKAIMEGEEKERSRLAHDLHDGVNSQLTAVKSFLLAVQKEHPYLTESKNFNHAKQMLTETASDIRKVVHNLVPDDLIQKGLAVVVEDFCAGIFAGKEMNTDVQVYGEFKGISISLSLTIYRLVQELLHNIVKHARATSVTVLLSRMDEEISLIVEDDGVGIPTEVLNNSGTDGIGLSGIRDRVQAHNGQLSIESGNGKGTVVSITFQVHAVSYKEKVSRY